MHARIQGSWCNYSKSTQIPVMYGYVTWRMTTEISVMYGSEGVKGIAQASIHIRSIFYFKRFLVKLRNSICLWLDKNSRSSLPKPIYFLLKSCKQCELYAITQKTGFVIVVVRLSKTTKNRHGQPKIHLWNTLVVRTDNQVYFKQFCHWTRWYTPYRDTQHTAK